MKQLNLNHVYNVIEALQLLKEFASDKFNESMDISVNLGVDPGKSDQVVRTATNLPKVLVKRYELQYLHKVIMQ